MGRRWELFVRCVERVGRVSSSSPTLSTLVLGEMEACMVLSASSGPCLVVNAVGEGMLLLLLLLDALALLSTLFCRLNPASGLWAESGVMEPLVPDRSILRRPFRSAVPAVPMTG